MLVLPERVENVKPFDICFGSFDDDGALERGYRLIDINRLIDPMFFHGGWVMV